MKRTKFKTLKLATILTTVIIISTTANAGTLNGGQFDFTFDSPDNLLNGLTLGAGSVDLLRNTGFFPGAPGDGTTNTDILNAPHIVPNFPLGFKVNNPGISWGATQDNLVNSSTFVAAGSAKLDGVIKYQGSSAGSASNFGLLSGDYDFKYDVARTTFDANNSGWALYNNISFGSLSFDLRNIVVNTNGDDVTMTGDIWWSPNTSSFLFKLDGSTSAGKAGTFAFTSAVPVPAAVWMFGTGLLGLVGSRFHKQKISV